MMKQLALMLALAAVLSTPGCFSRPAPEKNYYNLAPDYGVRPASSAPKRYTLLVGQISVAAGLEGRSLVYQIGPNQFKSDFYNELVAPPDRLLADQMVQFLEAFNGAVQVVKMPGMKLADFGIEAYIEKFYGVYAQTPARAAVSVKFVVNDLRGSAARVILSKVYQWEAPVRDQSPADLVDGLGLCLSHILAELNQDLVRLFHI